jgi:two-component system, NarL family, response regulator DesR
MIRIGIAEDQALVRESLAIVLDLEKDMNIVWKAESGTRAVEMMLSHPVDVVLMDLRMPDMDGVMASKQIFSKSDFVHIIVLTTFDHDEWILDAIHIGADCYFLKEVPPKLLIEAIRLIHSGNFQPEQWTENWRKYAPEIQFRAKLDTNHSLKQQSVHRQTHIGQEHFTHRDLEILRRIGQNMTNLEIAQALFLTEGTVKNYVSNLYQKMGVKNRSEAIRYVKDKGLF